MEKGKNKERIKTIIIAILIIIIILLLLRGCGAGSESGSVIKEDNQVVLNDNSSGQVRIKLNPVIDVKDGVMENLNFCNYNEDRLLKVKIKVDDEYIYESDFIKPKEVLESDIIKENNLKLDGKEAIGEIYSYTTDKEFIGQTNVVLQLKN